MRSSDRGFTLLELLVVITIIGLLASVVFIAVEDAREKGRDARRARDAHEIQNALELFYDANGQYPSTPTGALVANLNVSPRDITPYINPIPLDPENTG